MREAGWLYEAAALALEERLALGGAIPARLVEARMARPELSLMSDDPELMGSGALFLSYLMETRGDGILLGMWERAAAVYGENSLGAIGSALRLTDLSSLHLAWREFTIWNGYPETEQRPPALFTSLAVPVPAARPARQVTSLPDGEAGRDALRIEPMGATYIQIRDVGDVGSVQVEVETDPGARVSADVLVSWRHVPAGWLAVPLRFQDGRARLGVPLETGGQLVLVVRNDATEPGQVRPVSFDVYADPAYPFELSFLSADASPGRIDLSWGSESESRIYGWMVYRAQAAQGPFRPLSRFPVPSVGDSPDPLAYHYTDTEVVAGRLYYYQVEGITVDGLARRSPMVARRAVGEPAASD
jgi:hypothetical protein